jgi:hypothetical protein
MEEMLRCTIQRKLKLESVGKWSPRLKGRGRIMTHTIYTTLHGTTVNLASLTSEEAAIFAAARKAYVDSPKWIDFKQTWLDEVVKLYDRQKVSRRETVLKPLFRAVQDLGSRLMVNAGYARMPDYREQLLSIIETKFDTRREFCEAAGVSEDMLSHVLKGRKDLSIGALEELLGKIGYGLSLVPLTKAAAG